MVEGDTKTWSLNHQRPRPYPYDYWRLSCGTTKRSFEIAGAVVNPLCLKNDTVQPVGGSFRAYHSYLSYRSTRIIRVAHRADEIRLDRGYDVLIELVMPAMTRDSPDVIRGVPRPAITHKADMRHHLLPRTIIAVS